MEFSQAIKNIKINIDSIIKILEYTNKLIINKPISFPSDISKSIKDIDSITKKTKAEIKNINIEAKQIEKELKDAKGVLSHEDFSDIIYGGRLNSDLSNKDLALLLILEKPVIELKGIIAKKIKEKYLPIESWDDSRIFEEFNNTHKYPINKDIFKNLPKEYKPKTLPKKREDVIKKLIEVVNKTRSGYIAEKI